MRTETEKLEYAEVIRNARREAGLNQTQLASLIGVSRNTVAGWETGHSRPDLDSIPAICGALHLTLGAFFGIREGVTRQEKQLINAFRRLEKTDQEAILWQIGALVKGREASKAQFLSQKVRSFASDADLREKVISLYRSDLSAAAGTGVPLDDEQGERIWLWKTPLTNRADQVIPVNGHSMEPTFMDGDMVLVEKTDSLREGELGVFVVDGEGYVKEYQKDGLHSHNPDYETMRFGEENDVRCVGRVLGKIEDEMYLTEDEERCLEMMD